MVGPQNTATFAAQPIGGASLGQLLTLMSSGALPVTLTSLGLTGVHPAEFALGPSSTCAAGTVLAPGATCLVEVVFTPAAAGDRSARLEIADSASGAPHRIPLLGKGLVPGAAVALAGPIDLRVGYPAYYQDGNGLKLQLCYDDAARCLSTLPNAAAPPRVDDVGSNWEVETFYWAAEIADAAIGPGLAGSAKLVMALEGTFANDEVVPGEQLVFNRTRIRLDGLTPNRNYTVTWPFGQKVLRTDGAGSINETIDTGCLTTPCDFRKALDGEIFAAGFLRWDPAFAPAAPAGFLGDFSIPHRITGSPTGNNFFRIQGPNAGGTGINSILFRDFNLSGQILP